VTCREVCQGVVRVYTGARGGDDEATLQSVCSYTGSIGYHLQDEGDSRLLCSNWGTEDLRGNISISNQTVPVVSDSAVETEEIIHTRASPFTEMIDLLGARVFWYQTLHAGLEAADGVVPCTLISVIQTCAITVSTVLKTQKPCAARRLCDPVC